MENDVLETESVYVDTESSVPEVESSFVTEVDFTPILDRLDSIESTIQILLVEDVEPVSDTPGSFFGSLDQVFLFLILLVLSCIFLFRGKK